MKYVFLLVLLLVGAVAAAMGGVMALRWVDNMTQTPRIVTGERVFAMPAGVIARGGSVILPREQRELAAKIPNPVKVSAESVAVGKERYQTFCLPCHGPEAKGGVTGPVAVKFVPPPDLTNAQLQAGRTDGYWHSYIMAGGAVMPSYAEAMSSEEAWHIVNFLRSVASR
ncbi:MAG TPA: c-type cytochrome [Methylomirabilota bacterium]|jgi:mono/diheme cytochrome c family protein|nr:c-type cytochrome [Methylomirabilota bacterium]